MVDVTVGVILCSPPPRLTGLAKVTLVLNWLQNSQVVLHAATLTKVDTAPHVLGPFAVTKTVPGPPLQFTVMADPVAALGVPPVTAQV
jgi:hypothetical protein